jgi:hypothetical protein
MKKKKQIKLNIEEAFKRFLIFIGIGALVIISYCFIMFISYYGNYAFVEGWELVWHSVTFTLIGLAWVAMGFFKK